MKKKVLIISSHHFWLYKLRKELIEALLAEGYEVYLSLPYGDYVDKFVELGCIFIDTPFESHDTNILSNFRLLMKYNRLIREVDPDLVIPFTLKPMLFATLICRVRKIYNINSMTGRGSQLTEKTFQGKIYLRLLKFCFKGTNYIFFQNEDDMNFFIGNKLYTGNYELVPGSGVNLSDYEVGEYPEDDHITIFNFIGRIMKSKGIEDYLKASEIIKAKYNNAQFNIIGYVEKSHPYYEQLIDEYVKKGYVNFWGFQENIRPFVMKSHCTIQPSIFGEGISNVILESAAMGRPSIVSDIAGCKSAVDDDASGYIFKAGDPDSLAKVIERFIELSIDQKRQMGANARKKVESDFSREIVVSNYMKIINKLLSEK